MTNHRDVVPVVKQERAQATVSSLLEATIDSLEAHGESGVRLDDILDTTGVARSSLYHHFGDRDGLIDAARVVIFSRDVDADIRDLDRLLERASTAEEFRDGLHRVTAATQSPARRAKRMQRAYTIGAAQARPELAAALATEQQRLTDRLTTIVLGAQARGWVRNDLDPRAVAVLVQAYTLGRVVSDIDAKTVEQDGWVGLIAVLADAIMAPASS